MRSTSTILSLALLATTALGAPLSPQVLSRNKGRADLIGPLDDQNLQTRQFTSGYFNQGFCQGDSIGLATWRGASKGVTGAEKRAEDGSHPEYVDNVGNPGEPPVPTLREKTGKLLDKLMQLVGKLNAADALVVAKAYNEDIAGNLRDKAGVDSCSKLSDKQICVLLSRAEKMLEAYAPSLDHDKRDAGGPCLFLHADTDSGDAYTAEEKRADTRLLVPAAEEEAGAVHATHHTPRADEMVGPAVDNMVLNEGILRKLGEEKITAIKGERKYPPSAKCGVTEMGFTNCGGDKDQKKQGGNGE